MDIGILLYKQYLYIVIIEFLELQCCRKDMWLDNKRNG